MVLQGSAWKTEKFLWVPHMSKLFLRVFIFTGMNWKQNTKTCKILGNTAHNFQVKNILSLPTVIVYGSSCHCFPILFISQVFIIVIIVNFVACYKHSKLITFLNSCFWLLSHFAFLWRETALKLLTSQIIGILQVTG